jgi:rhodanese-related sulfurtransferase
MPARSLSSDAKTEIRDFDPMLAKKMIHEDDGVLIDCRTPQEFQSGAPSAAVLFPYDQIPARIDEVIFSS